MALLTDEQIDRFWEQGYLVAPGGATAAQVSAMSAEINGWIEDSRSQVANYGDTADGKAVLSGDAIPMNRNFIDDIPSGIVIDVRESLAALARVREMKPVREAEHVGVHGDGRDAEAGVEEDVRYLPAHPGQCDQGIEIVGRLPAVRLAQDPA